MDVVCIKYFPCCKFVLEMNFPFFLIVVILIILLYLGIVTLISYSKPFKNIEIDTVSLGLGQNNITIKYNKKDQEIAYKLWVELSTRKIGLEFEEDNDVIVEVYNSWYEFFKISRELIKEFPVCQLKKDHSSVKLFVRIINEGLRPHLTTWQAVFRNWYEVAKKEEANKNLTPQELQKQYPKYRELVADLKDKNAIAIKFKEELWKIATSD